MMDQGALTDDNPRASCTPRFWSFHQRSALMSYEACSMWPCSFSSSSRIIKTSEQNGSRTETLTCVANI